MIQKENTESMKITVCFGVFFYAEEFQEKAVSYQEFADNPSIIDDPNLVVKIGSKYVRYIGGSRIRMIFTGFIGGVTS